MQSRSHIPAIVGTVSLTIFLALSASPWTTATEQAQDIPAWLQAAMSAKATVKSRTVVLQRARALYLQKVSQGAVKNPCYFAMDATRPGGFGRRFYVICEADRAFRAVPSGHGSGRNVAGVNFSNGISCAKNFSNAMDSKLTTGGPYVTAETNVASRAIIASRGKIRRRSAAPFVQFDGEGDTANARPRAIGGHPAAVLRVACRRKAPESPYANEEGYVPVGSSRITPPGAAMAAPAGRSRSPRKSSR